MRSETIYSMIKCLFIDLDLTLVDNAYQLYTSYIRQLAKYIEANGYSTKLIPNFEEFLKIYYIDPDLYGSIDMDVYRKYIGIREIIDKYGKHFWRDVWLRYVSDKLYGSPNPCSTRFLTHVYGKYITLITTGREIESIYVREELDRYGFNVFINKLYIAGDIGYNISKLDMYNRILNDLKKYSLNPNEIAVISDSPRDLKFSIKLGFNTIGFVNRYNIHLKHIIIDRSTLYTISSLCELLSIL